MDRSAQNYVRLHVGPATHVLHVPMNTIEGVLDPGRFLRIHRSHIVNVRRIAQLWSVAHGQYVVELKSGAAAPIRAHVWRTHPPRAGQPVLIDAGAEAPAYWNWLQCAGPSAGYTRPQ